MATLVVAAIGDGLMTGGTDHGDTATARSCCLCVTGGSVCTRPPPHDALEALRLLTNHRLDTESPRSPSINPNSKASSRSRVPGLRWRRIRPSPQNAMVAARLNPIRVGTTDGRLLRNGH